MMYLQWLQYLRISKYLKMLLSATNTLSTLLGTLCIAVVHCQQGYEMMHESIMVPHVSS